MLADWKIIEGDCRTVLRDLPPESAQVCVTSPPYWGLRDYGVEGQLGLEKTPEEYVAGLVGVFREVRRVLRPDWTLWLNLGDCYARDNRHRVNDSAHVEAGWKVGQEMSNAPLAVDAGLKPKDLVGIPWMVAFALRADGWYLRSDIIFSKPNPMPESVVDRPTKSHEYMFLLARSANYYYDADAIKEPAVSDHGSGNGFAREERLSHCNADGASRESQQPWNDIGGKRNRRSVWTISPEPFKEAHFAVMPTALVEPCILAGSAVGATVLDPFCGAGTVGIVAARLGRAFVGIELNPEYVAMARRRIEDDAPLFNRATPGQ